MAQPWLKYQQPQATPGQSPYIIPPDPAEVQAKADEEARKRRDQQLQEQAAALQAAQAQAALASQPLINQGRSLENQMKQQELTQGPPKSATEYELEAKAESEQRRAQTIRSITGEARRLFQQDIKGQPVSRAFGALEWADSLPRNERFRNSANNILPLIRPLVAQTAKEGDSDKEMEVFLSYIPHNDDSDITIEQKFKQLEMLIGGMVDGKTPSQTLAEQNQDAPVPLGITAGAGGGSPPSGPTPMPLTPGGPGYTPAEGSTRTVEANPELTAEYRSRLAAGQQPNEIIPWLQSKGMPPQVLMQAIEQIKYRDANPNVPIDRYSITATKEVPLSLYEQGATAAGNFNLPGGFSPGAYAVGAGQFLSGNTLDNLSGDPARAQLATDVMRASNPGSTFAGEMSGGILAALTGEAGLARLGMASGIGRAGLADAGMGAANGAGMADGGDRLAGAGQGALAAAAGSLGGSAAMKGAGRAFSPTGGPLRPLYDAGVRPTPGQRFGESGTAGRLLNATEEALQSVPVVGSAIRGARQGARDQFQIGAFNDALKEIGETLPPGARPGTRPHEFAQKAFNRVYTRARSGMTLVADEQLSNDLQQLAPDISTLGPAARDKLKRIMDNNVNNRTVDGVMHGGAYQKSVSDLGRQIARYRKSPMAEDQALADILEGIQGSLDAAARRHSDPDAVALLDAADAGYAKLVRIEEAARRRGGEPGTFSPTNFDSSVQKSSGGVRSKAYLRGDALMQDYATAGKSLDDKLPNSGTADRVMAGYAVGSPAAAGAVYAEPVTASVLGAIATAYAPGVRRALTKSMAPAGPTRKWIAQQLEKRARLAGRAGAAGAAASLPGTAPGQ